MSADPTTHPVDPDPHAPGGADATGEQDERADTVHGDGDSWVVVVARSPAERARIARRLGAVVPLVMVRSAREARAVLQALAAGSRPDPEPDVEDADSAAAPWDDAAAGGPDRVRGLVIDTDRHVARSATGEVRLTPLEHAFMLCLLRRPGRVWTFAELTRAVWGTEHLSSTTGNVHAVVKRLRHKLARISTPVSIQAIRGIGFRLSQADAGTVGAS